MRIAQRSLRKHPTPRAHRPGRRRQDHHPPVGRHNRDRALPTMKPTATPVGGRTAATPAAIATATATATGVRRVARASRKAEAAVIRRVVRVITRAQTIRGQQMAKRTVALGAKMSVQDGWTAAGRGGRGRSGPQTPQTPQQQQQQQPDPPAVSGITQASRAGWNGSSPADFADLPVTSPKSDEKADRRQAARPERAVYVPPKRNEDPGPQVAAQGGKKGGRGKGRGPSQDARDNR